MGIYAKLNESNNDKSATNRAGENLEAFRKIKPFRREEYLPPVLSGDNDNSILQLSNDYH